MMRDDNSCHEVAGAERLLASGCHQCWALARSRAAPSPCRRSTSAAMTAHCPFPTPLMLLWILLLATLSCVGADDPRDAMVLQQRPQDFMSAVDDYDSAPAKLVALWRLKQQQQQQQPAMIALSEPDDEDPVVTMPVAMPLIGNSYIHASSKEEAKRGSYMALCHFKICNMGRKRNLRLSPRIRL